MTEKDLVQEALQQMKNLEDVVQENAKGILGATMAQEISELVKESLSKEAKTKQLNEQPELEDDDTMVDDTAIEVGDVAPDMNDMPVMGDEDDYEGDELGDEDDDEEDVDVFDAKMLKGDELWSLFKKMDPNNDSFVIDSDGDNIHIKDDENDVEYILKMNEETEEDMNEEWNESMDEDLDEDWNESMDEDMDEDMDEVVYEITMDEDMDEDLDESMDEDLDEDMDEDLDESMDEDLDEDMDEDLDESMDEDMDESVNEAKYMIKPVMGKMKNKGEAKENKTMKSATKGMKKAESKEGNYMSKPVKPTKQTKVDGFKKETLPEKGVSNVKKSETKEGMGKITPSAKSKGVGMNLKPKKFEYKEAARTYGNGSKEGRGLRKGITPNRNYVYENETLKQEIEVLKEKNEEYRKALNVFREKLNEVAVFNSNLAYATRLFTEHSTSKTEKINILRRFDDVESLKESKSLYTSIKNELSQDTTKVVTESIERKIDKTASTGSATNLIESKTYENPQFLRMKDLMSKL